MGAALKIKNVNTVEPLYSRHHWGHSKCPDFQGVLISGVNLYTVVCIWDKSKCPDLRGVQISGCPQ